MFTDSDITRTDSRRLLTATGESDWKKSEIMSGCECVLVDGGMSKWTSLEDLLQKIEGEKVDDMAIECWRHEGKIPVATRDIERQVGGLFHDKGSTFNLENPKRRF